MRRGSQEAAFIQLLARISRFLCFPLSLVVAFPLLHCSKVPTEEGKKEFCLCIFCCSLLEFRHFLFLRLRLRLRRRCRCRLACDGFLLLLLEEGLPFAFNASECYAILNFVSWMEVVEVATSLPRRSAGVKKDTMHGWQRICSVLWGGWCESMGSLVFHFHSSCRSFGCV